MRPVTVRIDNAYSDGYESSSLHELEVPAGAELEEWWEEVVWPLTGDGHGAGVKLGTCYTATIVAGDPELVGESQEWAG